MSLIVVDSFEMAHQCTALLADVPVIALDTETTGLEWSDTAFLVSLATRWDEYVIPSGIARMMRPLWEKPRQWRFKNALFDLHMMQKLLGFGLSGEKHDATVYARLERNDRFGKNAYSLAGLAKREGWEKDGSVDTYIKKNKLYTERVLPLGDKYKQPRFDLVPQEIMYKYAAQDARLTYDLIDRYTERLNSRELEVAHTEADLTTVCEMMEWHGVRVSLPYTKAAMGQEELKLLAARQRFKELSGGVDFVASAKCLEPLFTAAGETIHLTDEGNPSFTKDILDTYSSPLAGAVRGIRAHEKLISTYYKNFINMATPQGEYHVIHPNMWTAGTRTRRFSYSEPNLQNLPKEEDADGSEAAVRACFVPRPGRTFVSLDYAQQEYRLMLAYANERTLIKKVMDGADVHQATADLMGISRKYAKTLNFAILYGAGPEKIAGMLGVSELDARRLKLEYFGALPKVERFIDNVIRVGRARGYVENWRGFKLHADREHAYALPNHLIQSGGAEAIKVGMVDSAAAGYFTKEDCLPVIQVHDQLVLDSTDAAFDRIPHIIACMENAFPEKNGMRLKVDVAWSRVSFAEYTMQKGLPDARKL